MESVPVPYRERYPVGTAVSIADLAELREFKDNWHLHHPLSEVQLQFASASAVVREVMFYHGGDPLYVLGDLPGVWHEECLRDSNTD